MEALFDGECTRMRKGGTFDRQAGPASTKCLSASPTPSLKPSSSSILLVVDSLLWVDGTVGAGSADEPFNSQSSAPLVTKVEKRLSCLPPRRLLRKLGNHSPVFCGMRGNGSGCRLGDPRGVMEEVEASLRLTRRECEGGGSSRLGACVNSAVN